MVMVQARSLHCLQSARLLPLRLTCKKEPPTGAEGEREPPTKNRMNLRQRAVARPRCPIGTTFREPSSTGAGWPSWRCSRRTLANVFRRSVSTLFVYRNERSSMDFMTASRLCALRTLSLPETRKMRSRAPEVAPDQDLGHVPVLHRRFHSKFCRHWQDASSIQLVTHTIKLPSGIDAAHPVRNRPGIRATHCLAVGHAHGHAPHRTIPRKRYGQAGAARHSTVPCTLHRSRRI